jgi:hypothetical protein
MTFWSGLMIGMWIGGFIGFAVAGVLATGARADAEEALFTEIKRLRGIICAHGITKETRQ